MRVIHATYSDSQGGAARASFRVHRSLVEVGVDSQMVVEHTTTGDPRVHPPSRVQRRLGREADRLNRMVAQLQRTTNPTLHSPALFSGGTMRRLRAMRPDVVNLHWVAAGLLTVGEIGRLRLPTVWRLADMWALCGMEHYGDTAGPPRWELGYHPNNRPPGHAGFDVDRWTWRRKVRAWRQPFHVVATTRWMSDQARASRLFQSCPVAVVPNPIDLSVFRPRSRAEARQRLGLPADSQLVLFGADGGTVNPIKGFDLLEKALDQLTAQTRGVEGVVFGQTEPPRSHRRSYPVHWLGPIEGDDLLAQIYSAADVMVVPSRQEAFGQTASEAQACGTPVVAFDTTGLPDVVAHGETGYLATPFDTKDLAEGIRWVLKDDALRARLGQAAREHAKRLWAPDVVARQYIDVYEEAIAAHRA